MEEKKDINKNDKSNNKLLFIIGGIVLFLIIAIVTVILVINLYKKKTNDIINVLGIDDYFRYVFTNDYEKNINLLNIDNEEQVYMYYYYNKNTNIYKIDFEDPTFEGNLFLTYAKWDEYMDYHKKVFGEESKHKMGKFDLNIDSIKKVDGSLYKLNNTSPYQCSEAENTKNCYMKLTKDTGITGDVTVSELERKDNVITGKVSFDSKSEYFEFTYEEKDDNYIIKSLKVIDKIEEK